MREIEELFGTEIVAVKQRSVDGFTFWLVKLRSGTISIVVRCPRCGQLGRLVKGGKRNQVHFYIFHRPWTDVKRDRRKLGCRFGRCSQAFEILERVYESVRKHRR